MIHRHPVAHWLGVAAVAGLGLLAFEVMGQSTNAQAQFEGRPAMSGAQAGLGAMAGPPQGGIGLQGNDGAQLNLRPQVTNGLADRVAALPPCSGPTVSAAENPSCLPQVLDEGRERRIARLGIDDAQQR
jgi:hypothetical protein